MAVIYHEICVGKPHRRNLANRATSAMLFTLPSEVAKNSSSLSNITAPAERWNQDLIVNAVQIHVPSCTACLSNLSAHSPASALHPAAYV